MLLPAIQAKKARERAQAEVISNFRQYYVVYGADRPCNEFNNYTVADQPTPNPNCNDKTTSIGPPPGTFVAPNEGGTDFIASSKHPGSLTYGSLITITCVASTLVFITGGAMWPV